MILFSWNSASDMVQKALNTGTDQIQEWPITDDPGTVEVPNALRDRVEKRPALGPNSHMIESSMGKLRRVKVRNVARRIWAIADILYKALEDPSLPEWIDRELAQILKSGRTFHEDISPREVAHLGAFCDSVIKVANTICVERAAAQLGGDSGVAASEISSAVSGAGAKTDELVNLVVG